MCLKNWMYLTLQQQKQSAEGQKNQASYLALKQNKIVSSFAEDGCFVLLQKSNVEKKPVFSHFLQLHLSHWSACVDFLGLTGVKIT